MFKKFCSAVPSADVKEVSRPHKFIQVLWFLELVEFQYLTDVLSDRSRTIFISGIKTLTGLRPLFPNCFTLAAKVVRSFKRL